MHGQAYEKHTGLLGHGHIGRVLLGLVHVPDEAFCYVNTPLSVQALGYDYFHVVALYHFGTRFSQHY